MEKPHRPGFYTSSLTSPLFKNSLLLFEIGDRLLPTLREEGRSYGNDGSRKDFKTHNPVQRFTMRGLDHTILRSLLPLYSIGSGYIDTRRTSANYGCTTSGSSV